MAIPMERIGGRAFSHSAGEDAEAEYDRLRDLARREAEKKKGCFDRAHEAYERGDGAEAKALSDEGKHHQKQQEAYNKKASEYIFRENNAVERVADDTIDLHGQFVEEAEDILEARIRDAQARGQSHLHVIVGKGNHSAGGVAKIRPRVERLCRELGLDFRAEENEGRLFVDLTGGKVGALPPLSGQPGGKVGGHGGGGYQGQQQQQQQYHQQQGQHHQQQGGGHHQQRPQGQHQQRPQEEENEVEKVVSKCLGCCVIM